MHTALVGSQGRWCGRAVTAPPYAGDTAVSRGELVANMVLTTTGVKEVAAKVHRLLATIRKAAIQRAAPRPTSVLRRRSKCAVCTLDVQYDAERAR